MCACSAKLSSRPQRGTFAHGLEDPSPRARTAQRSHRRASKTFRACACCWAPSPPNRSLMSSSPPASLGQRIRVWPSSWWSCRSLRRASSRRSPLSRWCSAPAARRLPIGSLLIHVIGVIAALAVLPFFGRSMVIVETDNARAVANVHTAFNVALALIFFPLLTPYARLLRRLLPQRVDQNDPSRPIHLDPQALETPVLALGGAVREALRMADVLESMLVGLKHTFNRQGRQHERRAGRRPDRQEPARCCQQDGQARAQFLGVLAVPNSRR